MTKRFLLDFLRSNSCFFANIILLFQIAYTPSPVFSKHRPLLLHIPLFVTLPLHFDISKAQPASIVFYDFLWWSKNSCV